MKKIKLIKENHTTECLESEFINCICPVKKKKDPEFELRDEILSKESGMN